MEKLLFSVQHSEKLARHMNFLMKKGSLYLKYNGNLLIHGCIPLDEEGNMEEMQIEGKTYAGRQLLDVLKRTCATPLHIWKRQMIWRRIWYGTSGQGNVPRSLAKEK